MHNIQHFHNRSTIVGDGHRAALSVDEFVHTTGSKSSANYIDDSLAGVYVANELRNALRGICTLAEQNDARLLMVGRR